MWQHENDGGGGGGGGSGGGFVPALVVLAIAVMASRSSDGRLLAMTA